MKSFAERSFFLSVTAIGMMLVSHAPDGTAQDLTVAAASTPRSRTVENVTVEGRREREASQVATDLSEFGNQVQITTSEEIRAAGYTNFCGRGPAIGARCKYRLLK